MLALFIDMAWRMVIWVIEVEKWVHLAGLPATTFKMGMEKKKNALIRH